MCSPGCMQGLGPGRELLRSELHPLRQNNNNNKVVCALKCCHRAKFTSRREDGARAAPEGAAAAPQRPLFLQAGVLFHETWGEKKKKLESISTTFLCVSGAEEKKKKVWKPARERNPADQERRFEVCSV